MPSQALKTQTALSDSASAFLRAAELGLARVAAVAAGYRSCCFTFHRATTAESWAHQPNGGFHVDLSYLERLITHLQRAGWKIVTLSDAIRHSAQPGAGRFVNFSIDDCYRDTAELVVPLFHRLSVPVTLFVTTGIPDRLFRLRDAGLETILQRETEVSDNGTIFQLRTVDDKCACYRYLSAKWEASENADAEYDSFCRTHGYNPEALDDLHRITWSMLTEISHDSLVEIGGHTVMHRRISALDDAEARAEIAGCRNRLETMLSRPVRHFAFPYGRTGDCGPRDFALAGQAGFETASTTRKGLIRHDSDPLSLPRNTLNGAHRRLPFAHAHLSGASGLAARIMHRD